MTLEIKPGLPRQDGTKNMAHALDQLHRDHANLAKLLDALDREVAVFGRNQTPDYEIIQGVVDYFLDYPDLYHHPREDQIARKLIEKKVVNQTAAQTLLAQHEELGQLTRRFAKLVESVVHEAELPRGDFLRAAREFIDTQRHHMEMEDEHFFPTAEALLEEEDWRALEVEDSKRPDPVFGDVEDKRFKTLRDEILKWSET